MEVIQNRFASYIVMEIPDMNDIDQYSRVLMDWEDEWATFLHQEQVKLIGFHADENRPWILFSDGELTCEEFELRPYEKLRREGEYWQWRMQRAEICHQLKKYRQEQDMAIAQ